MKISLNLLRYCRDKYNWSSDPAPDGVDKLVERIGAQLAAVEDVERPGEKYNGALIVKVAGCRKHENSDHLNICLVDDGGQAKDVERDENGLVQVVCGAPNVRAEMMAVWLPPGTTVPSSYGADPFVLGKRELRGVLSNGMLASPRELALGDSHEGILEIDDEGIKPGTLFAEQYNLVGDAVIDMENKMFTHRPDLFGQMGVARELAGIQGQKFTSPEWYKADAAIETPAEGRPQLKLEVRNEIQELVPRFVAVPVWGITVKPSPVWLQAALGRLGLRPINNVVDLTNYYMLLTGQPLHAYDYDKVRARDESADGATLVVRKPHAGEKLTLLSGKTIEPRADAILIASATQPIGLGGVMGGAETEVDDSTTNIILECATFDMYSIRRTSMAQGIFTDAVTRFTKGQSPLQNMAVLARIVQNVAQIAGGRVAGPVIDNNHLPAEVMERQAVHADVAVTADFVNQRLGTELSADDMAALLANVEFKVDVQGDKRNKLTVRAPFWRTDIEIPEDIVEEVGRLHGYDKLPLELPLRDLTPAAKDPLLELKADIRAVLSSAGANEVLTYSFVHGNLLDKAGQDKNLAFKLSNALSPDLQYYRLSLTPSLLDKVHSNIKAGYDEFALFEIGKAHSQASVEQDGLPREEERVALVWANKRPVAGAPYYQARKFAEALLQGLHIRNYRIEPYEPDLSGTPLPASWAAPFAPGRRGAIMAEVHGSKNVVVGIIGEYAASVRKSLKLPDNAAGFELQTDVLLALQRAQEGTVYTPVPRFPKAWQDICLRVPAALPYQELCDFIRQALAAEQPPDTRSSLTPVDIFARQEDTGNKQVTFRFSIASYARTLTDGQVSAMMDKVSAAAAEEFGAERV